MFSKKKTECRVCGYRFTPERENIYTAEEPRSALEMLTAAPTRFSAVDCPNCGCQIRLADRAPRIDLPAIVERHDADAEEKEDEAGGMKIGTACAIFLQINSEKYTDEEKGTAILEVLKMPTHNGISKSAMLEVIGYLLNLAFDVPEESEVADNA